MGASPSEPLDVVYTWVDGGDPEWRSALEASWRPRHDREALEMHRYRPGEDLRFSLRSVERFAPWVRRIHVVTSGQRPDWLPTRDGEGCGLEWVDHPSLFPDSADLPTFNSHAIESCLHRIPGLSERFLYVNDDVFLGRPCEQDLFTDGPMGVAYLGGIDLDRDVGCEFASDRACLHTRELVSATCSVDRLRWMPAHVPQLYHRDLLAELEARHPAEFARTRAAPFRSPDDFVIRIAHTMLAGASGQRHRRLQSGGDDYSLVRLTDDLRSTFGDLAHVERRRPRFFCLNDETTNGWRSRLIRWRADRMLSRLFPEPSHAERPGSLP